MLFRSGDNVDGATGLATAIGNKLPLAGGTMTGAIAMGANKITGLGTPTANTDAATKSYVDDQTTSDVAEGTNLYFTNQRALDATAAAYDAAGAAGDVAADLTTHENDTTAHGATGAVVGTTNTQTLTNKTIGDTLNFTGAGNMTINSDSHIVLTPAAGSSVKWGADVLATQGYADQAEADAKAYTDTREGLITTAYEAYTDLLLVFGMLLYGNLVVRNHHLINNICVTI